MGDLDAKSGYIQILLNNANWETFKEAVKVKGATDKVSLEQYSLSLKP
jgi:hypothetical protein